MEIKLIQANEGDLEIISNLAKKIWNHYYPEIISQEQIDYMLSVMYSLESLKNQTCEKKHRFYFIDEDYTHIGFVSVHSENNKDWFLHKLYIDQTLAKKGIGTLAFKEIRKLLHPKTIRLTVNRQNYKSINFYFKNGFKIEKVADFDIGNGFVMNDFVMVWERRH